ncbi:MAG: hypothetical protein ACK4MX_10940 [Thermaurantiacus sp.]
MAEPLKLRDLLDSLQSVASEVAQSLPEEQPEAAAAVAGAVPLLAGAIDHGLEKALEPDLVGLLVDGWAKARELRALADPARIVPGETTVVHLARHDIKLTVDPELELVLGGVALMKLKLLANFVCGIEGAALSVRDAAIVAVTPGRIGLEAKLNWGKKTIPLPLKRKTIDLPGRIDVSPPVSLARLAPAEAGG